MKALLATAALLLLTSCGTVGDSAPAEPRLFTAYNIWFESPQRVYSTNYQRGNILPAGSEVKEINRLSRGLEFVDVKSNMKFLIEFVDKHHPGVTEEQWVNRLLTTADFQALTSGLAASEIEAVKAGEVKVGMSRRAVLLSLGYPPEIATASRDLDVWRFWRHRFASYPIKFTDGKVSSR